MKRGEGVFPCLSTLDMSRVVTVTTYSSDPPSTKEGEAVKSFRKTNVCLALVPFKIIPLIARASEPAEFEKAPLIHGSSVFVLVETLFSPIVWRSLEDVWL